MHTDTQTPPEQSLAWAHCVPHGARERDIKIRLAKPTNNTANQDYSSRGEGCPNPWKPENRVSTIVENPFSNEGHQGHFPIKHRWHPVLSTLSVLSPPWKLPAPLHSRASCVLATSDT